MKIDNIIVDHFYGIKLTHVKGWITPSFWGDTPHSHEHSEIFIHISGELDIFVEKNIYSIRQKGIRIYRSGELHCGKTERSQSMEWYQISVPKAFFAEDEHKVLGRILFEREAGEDNAFLSVVQDEMVDLLREAFDAYHGKNALWRYYCHSAVIRILCLLNEPKHNSETVIHKDKALQKIIDLINLEFQSISTVEDLCRISHYSMSYVNRMFKKQLNVTPYRFLIGKKLNEAKRALDDGHSVTVACEMAGFNNYSNFITLFHRTFGMTPNKYKSRQRGDEEEKSQGHWIV